MTPAACRGATLAAPLGGASFVLPDGQVVCGELGNGWTVDPKGTRLRPPADTSLTGKSTTIHVAPSFAACPASKDTDTLVVSGPVPLVEPRTADLWVDEGHLDVRGTNLDGSRLDWLIGSERGSDTCVALIKPNGQQSCSYGINRISSADLTAVSLRVLPAGVPRDALLFDDAGHPVDSASTQIAPSRYIMSSALVAERHVDLSTGEGHLSLNHPTAVASLDCDAGDCELADGKVRVRSVTGMVRALTLRIRLKPRMFIRAGDNFVQTVNVTLSITYCPIALVSPPPLRDTDDVRVVVRIDAHCSMNDDSLRWTANGNNVPIVATESKDHYIYMLLDLGRLAGEKVTIAALRGATDASAIGMLSLQTAPPPQLNVSLRLEGYGEIDFIPTNRDATVSATAPNLDGRLVVLPVDGAYDVKYRERRSQIRGTSQGGFVVLRFALRDESLPGHLSQADLAHFSSLVQRAIRQVNAPAAIGNFQTKSPIVEVLCTDANGHTIPVVPGVPLHIPFAQRDGCRLLVHPDRIPTEDGEQRLDVDIGVTTVGGTARPEGHFSQRLALSHGSPPRIFWLHGVMAQFDRITVQLTHVTEDQQYIHGGVSRVEAPSARWTIVAENTRWRFSATVTIPVQLYRFSNDPNGSGTGPLALNFGVLSRFTWVTREGAEGFLGLEGGVIGMGLAQTNTRQLNIVAGLGIGVPLGNVGQPTQASINIHAWAAYRLGNEYVPLLDSNGAATQTNIALAPWSFIFGPSITFGNVGFDF